MTTDANKIRKLSAAGKTPDQIATKLKLELRAVNQVLRRVLKNKPGTSDAIVEQAEALGYQSLDATQREAAESKIAAELATTPSEVRRVLTPVNPQGRPKNPVCEACGQPIRKKRNQDGNPSNHHIDNIEIRDAEDKT